MAKNKDVLIIGAGRTASAIALNLAKSDCVDKFYLNSRTGRGAKDLSDIIKNNTDKNAEVVTNISEIDIPEYIIITLSTVPDNIWREMANKSNITYDIRLNELVHNLFPLMKIGRILKEKAQDKTKIIVTNPVDILTNYAHQFLGLENVYGFGLDLDSARYGKILGAVKNNPLCIGLHGEALPLLGWNSKTLYASLYEETDKNLLEFARANGIPYNLCGERFLEFFKKINSDVEDIAMLCAPADKSHNLSENICISAPVIVKQGKVTGHLPLELNSTEKEYFNMLVGRLEIGINIASALHKQYTDIFNS